METRSQGNEYRTTLVCIDCYDRNILQGRLQNPACTCSFYGLIDFFRSMERLLEQLQLPRAFTAVRSFETALPEEDVPPPCPAVSRGQLATFSVRVLFRQNASWQGSLQWLEGHQEASFRSVLELLLLLNSTVEEAKQGKAN